MSVRGRRLRGLLCALAGLLFPGPAVSQTAGGQSGWNPVMPAQASSSEFMGAQASSVQSIPSRDSLLAEAASARWGLGPIRLRPYLYIGNLGYTNNFFGSSEDVKGSVTASAGGGLGLVIPVGTRIFLRGGVYPGYTWYSRQTERSTFGGTYDTALFFYPGRAAFQLTGGFNRYAADLNSENPQPVQQSVLQGTLAGQYELSSRMSVGGNLVLQRRTYGGKGLSPEDSDRLAELDGTDAVWSLGLSRRIGTRLTVGVNYEHGKLSFVNQGSRRDATSEGVLGTASLDRGRLRININAGYREYRPEKGSDFPGHRGASGGGNVGYQLSRTLTLSVNGVSSLVSSIYADNVAYLESRADATLGIALKRKVSLTLGYGLGLNRYLVDQTLLDGSIVRRHDDLQILSASINIPLYKQFGIGASLSDTRYSSNIPGLSRSVFAVSASASTSLSFGYGGVQLIGPSKR